MRPSSIYMFGVVRSGLTLDLESRVYLLSTGRIAAVVSPCKECGEIMPLRRELIRHQRVIGLAMQAGTILPFAFGHVARNEREVLRLLRAHEASFSRELDRLDGKVQMGLKISWVVDNIFQHIVDGDPELAALRDHLFSTSVPPALADRIELGQRFEERRESERERLGALAAAALSAGAAVRAMTVVGEKAVADLTFLIGRDDVPRFQEKVQDLAAAWPAEYEIRVTGPWAPYNFVDLRL